MTMTILYLIMLQGHTNLRREIQLNLIKNEGVTVIFVIFHFLKKTP